MELIKIVDPIVENMDYSLTEEQCNDLLNNVYRILEAEGSMDSVLMEIDGSMLLNGITAIPAAIGMLITWLKNGYRIRAQKVITLSKELNDMYTKVEYMLKNDKAARYRHRNDRINLEEKTTILVDSRDPRKKYNITTDFIAYNPNYIIAEINEIMDYLNNNSKNKEEDRKKMEASLMKIIDDNFEQYHWYVEVCNPILKVEKFENIKLERALMLYKDHFSVQYNNISVFNQNIATEIQYMQIIEQAYKRMLSIYGKDREGKKLTDNVFKKLIKNVTLSIEFNDKIMKCLETELEYYTGEFDKLYSIIRS